MAFGTKAELWAMFDLLFGPRFPELPPSSGDPFVTFIPFRGVVIDD